MKTLSVVIPVFNMGEFIPDLVDSLERAGVTSVAQEILIVDDGSTDKTVEILEEIKGYNPKINLLKMERNVGRFFARLRGAEAAVGESLLFIDARVVLAEDFGQRLTEHLQTSDFLQPQPRINVTRNLFCLYWDRSHRAIFRRHFAAMEKGPLDLTPENYDDFLKGTTAVVMPKDLFIAACRLVGDVNVLSDDTAIMKEMVRHKSLRLTPDLWFWWVPRETWGAFLWRLYDRGPGMVEYHVFGHRGWIFWSIMIGLALLTGWLAVLVSYPPFAFKLLSAAILILMLSTRWLAQSWWEALRLAPLHIAVIFATGFGVLKGLLVNSFRYFRGELKWINQ